MGARRAAADVISWPSRLVEHERFVCGPEDEFNTETNGDPDSINGEEDVSGYDDMPVEAGWGDEPEDDEEDDE